MTKPDISSIMPFFIVHLVLLLAAASTTACLTPPGARLPPTEPCHTGFDLKPRTPEQLDAAFSGESANLCRADLTGVSILNLRAPGANFSGARLVKAALPGAFLFGANFNGAVLDGADFSNTTLNNARLSGASLIGTKLSGSAWAAADVDGVVFEPVELPDADGIAYATHLERMRFSVSPVALVKLRKAFSEAGYDEQARAMTYAIRHTETRHLLYLRLDDIRLASLIDGAFRFVFFDVTTAWGMSPGRALRILVTLIPVFAVPYVLALRRRSVDGIWCRWSEERMRSDLGSDRPVRLTLGWTKALKTGLQFSVLSASAIGWGELKVGDWLQRLQTKEYSLHATGWVRTLSGLQSLISVFLLALWALTYFGHPFE